MLSYSDFLAGVSDVGPFLPPVIVIAPVTGIEAANIGFNPIQAFFISFFIYSPSVMLAAFKLLESETPAILLIITSLFVGVRFMILSVSISPYLEDLNKFWRWFLAYFLWTPVYALSIARFESESSTRKKEYYLGTALPIWITTQLSIIVGSAFGTELPGDLQLQFVVPLAFIALLRRMMGSKASKIVALMAGILSVLGAGLPLRSGLIIAVLGGLLIGVIISWRSD
jgi:predicted branched-subunit amino acid permease